MDPSALPAAIGRLARTATREFSIDDMLTELCRAAALALGMDHVGVMESDGRRNRFVYATTAILAPLEQLQETLQQGPCHRSVAVAEPVVVPNLLEPDPRHPWPEFTSLAASLGMGAVVAVPLISRGRTWGTLDLYRSVPYAWSASEVDQAVLLADVAVSYLVMAADRDAARAAEEELTWRTLHDSLTGLPNRSLLFERLRHALAVSLRPDRPVAVVFIDVDKFKTINDTYGHKVGDAVLMTVADRMTSTLRVGDTLARLAGDEFVLVAENLPRSPALVTNTLDAITGRVIEAISAPMHVLGCDLQVTVSMGVAVSSGTQTAEDLLHRADLAMYAAKEAGGARVVVPEDTRRPSTGRVR